MTIERSVFKTTCPRDCYDSCGMLVTVEDGRVSRVVGDPEHSLSRGSLCGKCAVAYNGVWRDPSSRLTTPLRRAGKKGSGKFDVISWETALRNIAERLKTVIKDHGGRRILHTHYTGTCSAIGMIFPLRFFNRMGAVEVDPDTVCNKAGHMALSLMFGDSLRGFDPRTINDSKCFVIWGANPSASAPHVHRHWLKDIKATKIVIDPIRHATAAEADLHLQLRPGTDAVLAFSMLHVMVADQLIDRDFIRNHTSGWGDVEVDIAKCNPQWGSEVTGVPLEKIIEAARIFGSGPSAMWLGQGLQRQRTGGNIMRACGLLVAATGMIGKPGTGVLYMNGLGVRGVDANYLSAAHLNKSDASAISHMDLAAALEDPERAQALFTWNNNIAASSPEQTRLRAALEREDLFHVAIDVFPTDTVDFADYVLPAASFLEFNDILFPYFRTCVSAQVKTSEPIGESLPNQEIFRRLAREMGFKDPELQESDDAIICKLIDQTGINETFSSLAKKGTVEISAEPIIQYSGNTFPTRSGHIDISGDMYESAGLSRAPRPTFDLPPRNDRLRMLSPASFWLMNSSYGNDERIRKQLGDRTGFLHPAEASRRGIVDGATVRVWSEVGELPMIIGLTDTVPEGVLLAPKGRWPKLESSRANVNILNPGEKTDLGESSAVHSIEVSISAPLEH